MRHDTLFNNPIERRRVTYSNVWWDNAFSEEELDSIVTLCEKEELQESTTVGEKDPEKIKEIRISKTKFFLKNEKTGWIFDRFNFVAQSLNNQFYGFDLNGYENFQYTVYDSDGKYDWHMDSITGNILEDNMWSAETRKLTMILLLNESGKDFTGGEFQINNGSESRPIVPELFKGRILAFPSFMIHRVTPVLTGIRKSIVIWIEGPKFI